MFTQLLDTLAGPHGIDRYLELVRPTFSSREVRAEVRVVRRQTPDSVTLTLRPNANWRGFRAGQFVNVSLEIDGVRRTRCYSPASSEHAADGLLELTVKAHPEGLVSRHLNATAARGLVVALSAPDGDFCLPPKRPERLLLISGGSGITPVMSMLRTLVDEGHSGHVTFLHYARTEADAAYRQELRAIAATRPHVDVAIVTTREPGRDGAHRHFSGEHLRALAPDYAGAETYVCGPTGLIDAVRATWAERDLEDRLYLEYFVPPAPAPVSDDAAGAVRFLRSELDARGDSRPLLEQAETAGLTPDFGCRMGICHTCTCVKASGHVRNLRTGELSGAEAEEIQLCITAPVGDVEIDL